jgi:hypothetical protein
MSSLTPVRWLPARLAATAAAAVIAVEGSTVVALSTSRTAVVGFGLAVASLVTFTVTAADAIRRGERLRCRCFGADAGPIGGSQLARNCSVIAIAIVGLGLRLGGSLGAGEWPSPVVTATAVASGLAVAVVAIRWDDLAYLFAPSPRRRVT